MSVEQFETEVLELGVRHVRTPEGSEKYGLPIGAIITADAELYAEKNGNTQKVPEDGKMGKKAPKGLVSDPKAKKPAGQHMKGTISGKAEAEKSKPKPVAPKPPKPLNLKVTESKLTGNQHFSVGKGKYVAPNGSKLIRPASNPNLAYVVTPDGDVHAFTPEGEIPLPKPLDKIFAAKFAEGFEGDDEYALEEFENQSASHDLPSLKVGAVLNDADGNPQLKKTAEDTWEHQELGIKLKDADIQESFDSGDLMPDTTDEDTAVTEDALANSEAVNFAEMSKEEVTAALEAMKPGQKLTLNPNNPPEEQAVITKDEDGTWKTDSSPEGVPGMSSKNLSVLKSALKVGVNEPEPYNPLNVHTTNPLDPEDKPLIGVGDTPDKAWIKNSLPGAALTFKGVSKDTIWTKQEDGNFTNQKGGVMTQKGMIDALPMGGRNLTITKEGKEPKEGAAKKPSAPAPKKTTAPKKGKAKPAATKPIGKVGRNVPGEQKLSPEYVQALNDTLDDFEKNGPNPDRQKQIVDQLEPGLSDADTFSILNDADPGEQIHHVDLDETLTKQEDGKWLSDKEGVNALTSEQLAGYAGDLMPGPSPKSKAKKAAAPKKSPVDQLEELVNEFDKSDHYQDQYYSDNAAAKAFKMMKAKEKELKAAGDDEGAKLFADAHYNLSAGMQNDNWGKPLILKNMQNFLGAMKAKEAKKKAAAPEELQAFKPKKGEVINDSSLLANLEPNGAEFSVGGSDELYSITDGGWFHSPDGTYWNASSLEDVQAVVDGGYNLHVTDPGENVGPVTDDMVALEELEGLDPDKQSDVAKTAKALAAAPIGQQVHIAGGPGTVTKTENGWLGDGSISSSRPIPLSDSDMASFFTGQIIAGPHPGNLEPDEDGTLPNEPFELSTDPDQFGDALANMGEGWTLKPKWNAGVIYNNAGNWKSDSEENDVPPLSWSQDEIQDIANDYGIVAYPPGTKVPADPPKPKAEEIANVSENVPEGYELDTWVGDFGVLVDPLSKTIWDGKDIWKHGTSDEWHNDTTGEIKVAFEFTSQIKNDMLVFVKEPMTAKNFGPEHVATAGPGTQLISPDGKLIINKVGEGKGTFWKSFAANGKYSNAGPGTVLPGTVKKLLAEGWTLNQVGPEKAPNGVYPGKYSNAHGHIGTDVHMFVNPDGTGYYVNKAGDQQKLSAKAVQTKFNGGMDNYQGLPYNKEAAPAPSVPDKQESAIQSIQSMLYAVDIEKALMQADEGEQIHFQDSDATMTKAPSDSPYAGLWQSSITDKYLDAKSLSKLDGITYGPNPKVVDADALSGEPKSGPVYLGDTITEDNFDSLEVGDWFTNPGKNLSYGKVNDTEFKDTNGIFYQADSLKAGLQFMDSNGGPTLISKGLLMAQVETPREVQPVDSGELPDIIPDGSVEITDATDFFNLALGSMVFEHHNDGDVFEHSKMSKAFWNTVINGPTITTSNHELSQLLNSGESKFYLSPHMNDSYTMPEPEVKAPEDFTPDAHEPDPWEPAPWEPGPDNSDLSVPPPNVPQDAKFWDGKGSTLSALNPGEVVYDVTPGHPVPYKHVKTPNGDFETHDPSGGVSKTQVNDLIEQAAALGSLYYMGSAETPSKKDFDWLPGDTILSVADLQEQIEGTKLQYTKADGSHSYYTKLPNDSWLTPGGGVMASKALSGSAKSGKFKVESIPGISSLQGMKINTVADVEEPMFLFMDGDQITDFMQIKSFKPGQTLQMKTPSGDHLNFIVLGEDMKWKAPDDDPHWPGLEFGSGDLDDAMKKNHGGLWYVSTQGVSNIVTAAPEAPSTPDAVQQDEPELDDKTLLKDALVLKGEAQAALDGLEAHSSFHVKYGLKDLPASNPLTKEANQEELKQLAQEKYPDLKIKPAVVQYLKDYLGVKEQTNWEDALMEAAPKINIGSKTPKSKGVQGMDGGQFTQKEIQEAIDILEAFPGKIFKSELSKKGNPLGTLDPTAIVGFDKDKLVTKQKFIDTLKAKLVRVEKNKGASASVPTTKEEFAAYGVGTTILDQPTPDMQQYYTKINDSQWLLDGHSADDKYAVMDSSSFSIDVSKGHVFLHKKVDHVPDYAKTPEAIKSKEKGQLDHKDPNFSTNDLEKADLGTKATHVSGNKIEKTYPDNWTVYDAQGNELNNWTDQKFFEAISYQGKDDIGWTFDDVQDDVPTLQTEKKSPIQPGKYMTSANKGNAFIIVNADGTGTYYVDGDSHAITAEQVMNNYKAGMKEYVGLPADPEPAAATTAAKKIPAKKPAAKPKAVGDVPDGTYFGGNPNDAKTVVYEVAGDDVKVFKPATGLTASTGVKLGGSINTQWLNEAGQGASFTSQSAWYMGAMVPGKKWTKGANGKWNSFAIGDGTPVDTDVDPDKVGLNFWATTPTSHGMSSPVMMPKAKLNTIFSNGTLQDQYGNGVVPKGYSGNVAFLGSQVTVPALAKAKKYLETDSTATNSNEMTAALKELGLYWDTENWVKWRKATAKTEPGFEPSKKAMLELLDQMLEGVDTDIPESDAKDLFNWDAMGNAVMPLDVISLPTNNKVDKGNWIKAASQSIGDGKIIGQHLAKMSEWDRDKWIEAFWDGDFKTMYNLEVTAASQEGKAHVAGYLHPGFADNDGTHKIKWAPAVDGEISALDTVPGEWSSTNLQASKDEIDNYLIAAQMQNPTYLSPLEKRAWVAEHKKSNKKVVDALSAAAAMRKKNGEAEQTPPLVWTDNVQPAKTYDTLFEKEQLPTTGWSKNAATDYINDHPENKELQALYQEKIQSHGEYNAPQQAVIGYFQGIKDAETAEMAKVFYKKSATQTVKKATHPIFEYDDYNGHGPLGGHYFFKPSPQGDAYRSEAEHLGHEYGWHFGYSTAGSQLVTLDGKYGQLQKDLGGVSDMQGMDMSTLSADQIADIGKEHILDWFLDNDDTHSANMKILANGHIVGIDKGRAFKHFGKWQGLNPSAMDSNTQTVYNKLFSAIKSGKLSKEDVDKAYLQIQKRAQQMAKSPDEPVAALLAKGMEKRTVWDVSYTVNGKKVPQNLAGLTAAVLDRKSKLPEQIEKMWADIYKSAGFGNLPEPPAAKLGEEHYSGFDEAHFHENAFKVNAGGVSTLIGGAHSTTGMAIAWGHTNKDGSKDMLTQIELNNNSDEKVYSKLSQMSGGATGTGSPGTFSDTEYGAFYTRDYYRAQATLLKHADDKGWNQDRINEYNAAKIKLQKDLDTWAMDMKPNKDGNIKFPSGAEVPQNQLANYKVMLDFYKSKEASMDATITTQVPYPAAEKAKFQAYELAAKPKTYTHTSGSSMVELKSGEFIQAWGGGAKVLSSADAQAEVKKSGWSQVAEAPEGPMQWGGAQIVLNDKTFDTNVNWDGETGVITPSASHVGSWAQGKEFQVTLPTGETIFFRNRTKTSTLHSQYGRLTVKVPGAKNGSDYGAGVQRANDWIESYLGLDMSGADEESAELIYWKQMLPILTRRNHKAGSKWQKAFQDITSEANKHGFSTDDFAYQFSQDRSVAEQNAFYRKVWGTHFGQDKVNDLVTNQKFMPKYEGTDMNNKDTVHGRPVWHRFDVSLADLLASNPNAFPASHNTGGGDAVKLVASSGVHLATEERIRFFGGKSGASSSSDQQMGTGGQDQFARVWNNPGSGGFEYVYHPSVLLHTNTRFFSGDAFGADSSEKSGANPDPLDIFKNKNSNSGSAGGGNQLDIRWASSWLGTLEMTVFDSAADRDFAIQRLKKLGLETIRGLPVEDRLVMRNQVKTAMEKLKAHWQKEATP